MELLKVKRWRTPEENLKTYGEKTKKKESVRRGSLRQKREKTQGQKRRRQTRIGKKKLGPQGDEG